MKTFSPRCLWAVLVSLLLAVPLAAAEDKPTSLDQVVQKAAADYTERLRAATQELGETRDRLAAERKPLLDRIHALETKAAALEASIADLQSEQAQGADRRQKLQRDFGALQKNISYLNTLSLDALRIATSALLPGEPERLSASFAELQQQFDSERASGLGAAASAELLLRRVRDQLGGSTAPGKAVDASSNAMVPGTFVYLGPDVLFRSDDGAVLGTVRTREGSEIAFTYALPGYSAAAAAPLFAGGEGQARLDPSGGKALRLRETEGTVWQHIKRGGVVAFLIIGVGALALGLILQKSWELRQLRLSPAEAVREALSRAFSGKPERGGTALAGLEGATRELFAAGLRCLGKPKEVLEERLYAFTLQQRLRYERRLPLLAVIATASPLMGLLGTVMGMVKTFALITVFGTGNAAKLSSGISEVLVTTELGLAVAIPALVAHGFLAHRIQKKLSLLEHQSVEFLSAAGEPGRSQASVEAVDA